jgi:5-methylcytosine-specific restriction endonuclease McrA
MERADVAEGIKRCSTCGQTKSLTEFNWANQARGLRQDKCRACFSEYNRQRYVEKGEHIRATVMAYNAANRERVKAAKRAAYWRDVEASRARARASAAIQNPKRREAKQAWARADRAANPEKWRAKGRRDYARNQRGRQETQWRRRAAKLGTEVVPLTPALLRAKWAYWSGCCWMCGGEAVEWDHVKPLSKGGAHCLANLRPACVPCNRRKSASWPLQAAA